MKALIITGGESPPPGFLKTLALSADFVIAADSGYDTALAAGIDPDLVVGDFDSLSDREMLSGLPEGKVLGYPRDKDDTDTEIALKAAKERGAAILAIAGGGGGRLDHLVAILRLFERNDHPQEWHTQRESSFYLAAGESAGYSASPGALVSIFPLGEGRCGGMESRNLWWPLKGLEWERGYFGISNKSLGERIDLKAGSVPLLVMLPLGSKLLSQQR
ncbi:MAG: thiamine diphosphokinase [Spirochaetia bacterium]|jgi:thiamine pyrophosphokinase|nr:thiamine diphosphokinase [Spirochaetales bacterium]MDX9784313.1 thiamine diphosphokinase [Spirochaetia bacterium]